MVIQIESRRRRLTYYGCPYARAAISYRVETGKNPNYSHSRVQKEKRTHTRGRRDGATGSVDGAPLTAAWRDGGDAHAIRPCVPCRGARNVRKKSTNPLPLGPSGWTLLFHGEWYGRAFTTCVFIRGGPIPVKNN